MAKRKKTVSLGAKFVIVLLVAGSVPLTSEAQQNLTWDANDARMGVGGSGTWVQVLPGISALQEAQPSG